MALNSLTSRRLIFVFHVCFYLLRNQLFLIFTRYLCVRKQERVAVGALALCTDYPSQAGTLISKLLWRITLSLKGITTHPRYTLWKSTAKELLTWRLKKKLLFLGRSNAADAELPMEGAGDYFSGWCPLSPLVWSLTPLLPKALSEEEFAFQVLLIGIITRGIASWGESFLLWEKGQFSTNRYLKASRYLKWLWPWCTFLVSLQAWGRTEFSRDFPLRLPMENCLGLSGCSFEYYSISTLSPCSFSSKTLPCG